MRELRGSPDTGADDELRVPRLDTDRRRVEALADVDAMDSSVSRDRARPGLELLRSRLTDHVASRYGPREVEDWEADEYGQAIWGEATDNLSPDQRGALTDYSRERYHGQGRICYLQINKYLRGFQEGTPHLESHIRHIDAAQRIVPVPEDLMVVRGTTARAFELRLHDLAGNAVTERGYLSTSIGTTPAFDHTIWVHLHVPKGTPAIYLEGVTEHPGERELLLGRGLTYEVDQVDRDTVRDKWHVHGKILSPHEQEGSGS